MSLQLNQGAFTLDNVNAMLFGDWLIHSLSTQTTVNQHKAGRRLITYGAALAIVLAAPVAGADDGVKIAFMSNTAFAHTVTATSLLSTGASAVSIATFAAFAGAGFVLEAYQGKWLVLYSNGITFS